MNTFKLFVYTFFILFISSFKIQAQEHSIAREWNEVLLDAIRNDFARPTVHARNLYHSSIAMYDAWAAYEDNSKTFFLNGSIGNYNCPFNGVPTPENKEAAQEEAISYAMYRLLAHRFQNSPGSNMTLFSLAQFMNQLGYSINYTSTDYASGNPADLGNYIAENIISAGLIDGSNEQGNYENIYYTPVNASLAIDDSGNETMTDPNRWQPLFFTLFIDQSGNPSGESPGFLSPEWGSVVPFSLKEENKATYYRNGNAYEVYHDPGAPDFIDITDNAISEAYKWGFSLVATWSSHLDPNDGVMWDISPASIGNVQAFPETSADFPNFYDYENGGDSSMGHAVNPATGMPYEEQIVPRGDYARVLAEFWADGPDSETPPGHWFTILNTVNDNPLLEKKWSGEGEILDDLEWDVKAYLTLGGAMHDSAIAAWGVKGWYDYIRPISAIRYMAELGQSSDMSLANYHEGGLPLVPNFIELVTASDALGMENPENIGKVKVKAWRGPSYVTNEATDMAGVDWIMASDWMPYQRPTFVTPPFAGYVSGHSTFSRAAAEVLTLITGDEFFPGGMGEFEAPQSQFLVFEDGPSQDLTLQWATYRDASDQCSLSRIWGGIHPPCDDIPGRKIGEIIGPDAFAYANTFFDSKIPEIANSITSDAIINDEDAGSTLTLQIVFDEGMNTDVIPTFSFDNLEADNDLQIINATWTNDFTLEISYLVEDNNVDYGYLNLIVSGATDYAGNEIEDYTWENALYFDTQNAQPSISFENTILSDNEVGQTVNLSINFAETMNTDFMPTLSFLNADPLINSLVFENAEWLNDSIYLANYTLIDANELLENIEISVAEARDFAGNLQAESTSEPFTIDTENPSLAITLNTATITDANIENSLIINFIFTENMNQDFIPLYEFVDDNPVLNSLTLESAAWWTENRYVVSYAIEDANETLNEINLQVNNARDTNGNLQNPSYRSNLFTVDTKNPSILLSTNFEAVSDSVNNENFVITLNFDKAMDTLATPILSFTNDNPTENTLSLNEENWVNNQQYAFSYSVTDNNEFKENIHIQISESLDTLGNIQNNFEIENAFIIDTENPKIQFVETNLSTIEGKNIGYATFSILSIFDEPMDEAAAPEIVFPNSPNIAEALTLNIDSCQWLNEFTYLAKYDVGANIFDQDDIDIRIFNAQDFYANNQVLQNETGVFSIHIDPYTSIDNLVSEAITKVYPNPLPSGQNLNIDIERSYENLSIQLINVTGQVVYSEEKSNISNSFQLENQFLESGIYFLFLGNEQVNEVVKVVVQ